MTEPFTPGEDIDEIAAQYVQLFQEAKKVEGGIYAKQTLVDRRLKLMARLINRYGQQEANRRIQLAQESWDLLTPKEVIQVFNVPDPRISPLRKP